jgi:hypothetical protein
MHMRTFLIKLFKRLNKSILELLFKMQNYLNSNIFLIKYKTS